MVKKCIVCNIEAEYKIKDTSDYYCKGCAEENFSDLSLLLKIEEEAKRLKEFLKNKIDDIEQDMNNLEQNVSDEPDV